MDGSVGVGACRAAAHGGRAQRERDRPARLRRHATPVEQIALQAYADRALEAIERASGPVVLVAHSMGGIVVSCAAEQRPEKIRRAVYVAAFMLPNGQALFGFTQGIPEFAASKTLNYLEIDEPNGVSRIKPEGIGPLFVNDGTDADVEYVHEHAHADFLAPSATPISISDAKFGPVARTYIETLQDQTVPLAAQRKMNELTPGADVHSLDTGHSPFLTRPRELADLLLAHV